MIYIVCTQPDKVQKDLEDIPHSVKNQIKICDSAESLHLGFPIIHITDDMLFVAAPWYSNHPPIFFPEAIPYHSSDLIALIFAFLSDFESANEFIGTQSGVFEYLKLFYSFVAHYSLENHNFSTNGIGYAYQALALHYGLIPDHNPTVIALEYYQRALENLENEEHFAFVTKHYCILLNDLQAHEELVLAACEAKAKNISESAQIALLNELYAADLAFANEHSNFKKIKEIESNIATCIQFYQTQELAISEAFSLIDAGIIAQIQKNYSESLAHLNKAHKLFTENAAKELAFMVDLQKGKLLLVWAQTGQFQFYREALKSFQQALNGYTAEENPEIYAEIQHQLGIIYAEIPDEIQKRGIWMGLSLTAFEEALKYFTPHEAPYEYALICNHIGNAYTKFPANENENPHLLKALDWYQKALEIRTVEDLPEERALTLLNYLEVLSSFEYPDERVHAQKQEIIQLANEVLQITDTPDLQQLAQSYLPQQEALNS